MLRSRCRVGARADVVATVQNTGFTVDVSAEGARIAVPRAIDQGTSVRLRVHLPDAQAGIDCVCRAVWCKPSETFAGMYEVGMSFVDMTDDDRLRLEQLCSQLAQVDVAE